MLDLSVEVSGLIKILQALRPQPAYSKFASEGDPGSARARHSPGGPFHHGPGNSVSCPPAVVNMKGFAQGRLS